MHIAFAQFAGKWADNTMHTVSARIAGEWVASIMPTADVRFVKKWEGSITHTAFAPNVGKWVDRPIMTFYDQFGSRVIYTHDDTHLYLFSGHPVGYLRRDSVYGFDGRHLGWFINGWIYDHYGSPRFFSEKSKGGPLKPLKKLIPLKSLRKLRPLKAMRQLPPLKPVRNLEWSGISVQDFFDL
jgi:hypothetical protein